MPPSIYDSAVLNFQMAADLLISLQGRRLVLSSEVLAYLDGRPKILLAEGYNSFSPCFGICIPQASRCEISSSALGNGLEFRNSGAIWMTMEGLVSCTDSCDCYIDADMYFPSPTMSDVFLRDFTTAGVIRDSLQTEWSLGSECSTVCKLRLPKAALDVANRRVIVHFRRPPARFIVHKLAMTLI